MKNSLLPLPPHHIKEITTFDSGEATNTITLSEENRKALTSLFDLFLETLCRISSVNPSLQNNIYEQLKERMKNLNGIQRVLGNIFTNTLPIYYDSFKTEFVTTVQQNIFDIKKELEHAPTTSTSLDKLELKMDYSGVIQTGRYSMEFVEEEELGHGGFAIVKKVFRRLEEKCYAIKIIDMSIYSSRFFTSSGFDEAVREVRALAHLNHPNIVLYHTSWIEIMLRANVIPRKGKVRIHSYYSSDTGDNVEAIEAASKSDISNQSESDNSDSNKSVSESEENTTSDFENYQEKRFDNTSSKSESIIFQSASQKSSDTLETQQLDYQSVVKKSTTKYTKELQIETLVSNSSFLNQRPSCHFFIQMELCGDTLDKYIQMNHKAHSNGIPINIDEIYSLLRQMLDAIAYFHSKNIIHRDLKPKNIFFDKQNSKVIKIGDFGLASIGYALKDVEKKRLELSQGLGTYPYSAPEQRNGKKYDSKVDIYSLGIILLEILYPFKTRSELLKVVNSDMEVFVNQEIRPSFPQLAPLILSMTDLDPSKRPTAKQLLTSALLQNKLHSTYEERKLISASRKEQTLEGENVDDLKQEIESLKIKIKDLEAKVVLKESPS